MMRRFDPSRVFSVSLVVTFVLGILAGLILLKTVGGGLVQGVGMFMVGYIMGTAVVVIVSAILCQMSPDTES